MKIVIVLLCIPLLIALYFVFQAHKSKSGEPLGIKDGQLHACTTKPNCVCSEFDSETHGIEPIAFPEELHVPDTVLQWLSTQVEQLGGVIVAKEEHYLAATFSTPLMGYVDDLELRIDTEHNNIHVRSASRVGYSDLGANRTRVEQLRALLKP